MYGGMIYKYVLGSRALAEAISYNVTGDHLKYRDEFPWLYYVCVCLFGGLSLVFSLGNIDDSRGAQVVFFFLRLAIFAMLIIASVYVIFRHGARFSSMKAFDIENFYLGFSSIIFVYILHPSIPAFLAPVREQIATKRYYFWLFFLTMLLLIIESTCACIAFQGYACDAGYPFGLSVSLCFLFRICTTSTSSVSLA